MPRALLPGDRARARVGAVLCALVLGLAGEASAGGEASAAEAPRGVVGDADAGREAGVDSGGDVDAATRRLLRAADRGNVRLARAALDAGARIDENRAAFAGPDRQPPLVAAALRGHVRVVRLLLERGADPAVVEKDGFTVWHAAAYQGRGDVLELLHAQDVPGYGPAADGFTPLHRAVWGTSLRHARAVELLTGPIGRACDEPAADGRTPLEMARHERTRALLEACLAARPAQGAP